MAEGWLDALGRGRFDVESAGTEATRVHPLAIRAMRECGIDISGHTSKTIDRFVDQAFDIVITVCDAAAESCPAFPHPGERRHWSFPDTSRVDGSEEERYGAFVAVRDAIRRRMEDELIAAQSDAA